MSGNENPDGQDESRRILDRIARESEPGRSTGPGPNQREDDPIEYWGTRIGRALGFIITIGLITWFAIFIARSL